MMHMLATILALAVLGSGQPAAKPDFSGEWKMNPAKSDFGPVPAPTSITRSIKHAEPAMTIVEQQQGDTGEQNMTRKYVTDGSDTTFTVNGADVKSKASWNENTLVVVSTIDGLGITFNDRMNLSADGKTLTSLIHLSTAQGDLDLTIVFERQ